MDMAVADIFSPLSGSVPESQLEDKSYTVPSFFPVIIRYP
jgi:hypothetical protein